MLQQVRPAGAAQRVGKTEGVGQAVDAVTGSLDVGPASVKAVVQPPLDLRCAKSGPLRGFLGMEFVERKSEHSRGPQGHAHKVVVRPPPHLLAGHLGNHIPDVPGTGLGPDCFLLGRQRFSQPVITHGKAAHDVPAGSGKSSSDVRIRDRQFPSRRRQQQGPVPGKPLFPGDLVGKAERLHPVREPSPKVVPQDLDTPWRCRPPVHRLGVRIAAGVGVAVFLGALPDALPDGRFLALRHGGPQTRDVFLREPQRRAGLKIGASKKKQRQNGAGEFHHDKSCS